MDKEALNALNQIGKELHDIKLIMEFTNHIPKDYLTDDTYDEKFAKAHSGKMHAGKITQR